MQSAPLWWMPWPNAPELSPGRAMTAPFGPVYAEHYDLFYQHKDYEAECSFLEADFSALRRPAGAFDPGLGLWHRRLCVRFRRDRGFVARIRLILSTRTRHKFGGTRDL